jgi:hypothetical protein
LSGRLDKRQVLRVGHRVTIDPEGRQRDFMPRQVVVEPGGMAVEPLGQLASLGVGGPHDGLPGRDKDHSVPLFGSHLRRQRLHQNNKRRPQAGPANTVLLASLLGHGTLRAWVEVAYRRCY